MKSLWNDIKRRQYDSLDGDIQTDVLIIGGGMCGLLCAHMLCREGVDCTVVERDRILNGITNGTTAKITYQHGLIYDDIIKKYGTQKAKLYYKSQKKALDTIVKLAADIECDFEICDSYVYSLSHRENVKREADALNKIGCRAEFCEETELPFRIAGAVRIENQAKFHPLKFAYEISKNLNIYENTEIIELRRGIAITNKGKIRAKKIVVATHFPFINKHGAFFVKMYQHRSYVLALKGADKISGMYVDEKMTGMSFRNYNDLLLLGGGGHRTGKTGGNWQELMQFKDMYYPNAKIVGRWAAQDCMTLDSLPYIGCYSKATPDLYVATGFNKWGMTSSMVSAMVLRDMICKLKSEYDTLYNPSRSILHPQLAVNLYESSKSLFALSTPRCPHMGCALKYNRQEHSWDCLCHGSRFEEDGKLINGPATDDKKL